MKNWSALVIEDDPSLSAVFGKALQAVGFQVEIAETGDEARTRLASTTPDVITLDLHLPDASGTELLSYIRADARLARTRVIITTADPILADTMHDQADIVLIKPASFAQLRDLAARLSMTA